MVSRLDVRGHHNLAEALWARGSCWVTIATPESIELLNPPANDPLRQFLVATLTAQVRALARHPKAAQEAMTTLVDLALLDTANARRPAKKKAAR